MSNLKLWRFDVTESDGGPVEKEVLWRTYAVDVFSAIDSLVKDLPHMSVGKLSGAVVQEVMIAGKSSDVWQNTFCLDVTRKHVTVSVGVMYLRDGNISVRV